MKICNALNYCLFIGIMLILSSCTPITQTDFPLEPMLIDLTDMPPDWYIASRNNQAFVEDFKYERTADVGLGGPGYTGGSHYIFQFRSERRAARTFERQLLIQFNSSSVASATPWQPPPELPYTSPLADQYYFACHISNINGLSEICQAMGQYDNYLVIFFVHVTEYMTYSDIEAVLEAIDARMRDALDK